MSTDNPRNDGNEPVERWARAAANLRSYREAQRARWGDVDEGVLSRFIAGNVTKDELERILRAAIVNPELLECIDAVQDALGVAPGLPELVRSVLLPKSVPDLRGYGFFVTSHPNDRSSGNYYDFIPLTPDRVAIILADLCGKGLAVALRMAKFSSAVRHCLLTPQPPALALESLNRLQCETAREDFVSLSLGILDRSTNRLTLALAGSIPPLLRRADGRIEELGEGIGGFPLGIEPESRYEQTEVELRPGDVVCAYTASICDSYNPRGELFSNSRLVQMLSDLRGAPEVIGQTIDHDISRLLATKWTQVDDITLIYFGPHDEPIHPK